jgi:hypothetical protein
MHGYVDFDFDEDEDEDEEDDEEDDAVVAPEPDLRGYEHLRLVGPALLEAAAIAKEGGSRATVGRSRAERVALRSQSTDRAASGGFPLSGDALPRSLNFKKNQLGISACMFHQSSSFFHSTTLAQSPVGAIPPASRSMLQLVTPQSKPLYDFFHLATISSCVLRTQRTYSCRVSYITVHTASGLQLQTVEGAAEVDTKPLKQIEADLVCSMNFW